MALSHAKSMQKREREHVRLGLPQDLPGALALPSTSCGAGDTTRLELTGELRDDVEASRRRGVGKSASECGLHDDSRGSLEMADPGFSWTRTRSRVVSDGRLSLSPDALGVEVAAASIPELSARVSCWIGLASGSSADEGEKGIRDRRFERRVGFGVGSLGE
jgi:hypothetical protein